MWKSIKSFSVKTFAASCKYIVENQKLYKKYTHLIKTLNPANVTNVCEAKGAECDSFRHIYLHDKTVVENYLCKIIDTKDNGQRINKNSTVPVKESLVDLKNRSKKKKKIKVSISWHRFLVLSLILLSIQTLLGWSRFVFCGGGLGRLGVLTAVSTDSDQSLGPWCLFFQKCRTKLRG